jgi:hypothetical protein
VRSEGQIITFSAVRGEAGARRRRPGSRRSTSAWTVYAGADPAADLPWARGPQAVAVVLSPGGRRQTTSRFPSRRHSSSKRADLRSPWAARLDEQRGRRQAIRDLSRFRRLSRLRLLASTTHHLTGHLTPISAQTLRVTSAVNTSSRNNTPGTTTSLAPPATASRVRAGLIEQSTRAAGNGFPIRLSPTRPAGFVPAGVTTQGETL